MKMDEEEKTQGSINTGQDMKDFIEHSLYKTLSHVKSNNNFYFNIKNPFAETIVEEWPLFLLMGTVLSLQGIKIGGQECYKILIKTSYDNEIKAMVTRKSDYKDHLCRQFNRIMKNKNQKYIFANLKCALFDGHLYFMIGSQTYIIQAVSHFYEQRLKPIQQFPKFKFSHINLSTCYTPNQIEQITEEGFSVISMRKKFQLVKREHATIVGHIQIIDRLNQKNSNKLKRLIIKITQTDFDEFYDEIGQCRLQVKYSIDEQDYVNRLIINNHKYLFSNPQLTITQNLDIVFVLNSIKKQCIIRLSQQPYPYDIQQPMNRIGYHTALKLKDKHPNRNIIKMKCTLITIFQLVAIYKCCQCNYQIVNGACKEQCSQLQTRIQFMAILRVADSTGLFLISLQNNQLIHFLQLSQHIDQIQSVVYKQCASITLITQQYDNKQVPQELKHLILKINKRFIQKRITGVAKAKVIYKELSQLLQNEKSEHMQREKITNRITLYKQIWCNGTIDKWNEVQPHLPFIHVLHVQQL